MNYELKQIPKDEQRLLFRLEQTDSQYENKVGTLRGDFGRSGDEFHHTWFPHDEKLNTDQFKAELTEVVDELRGESLWPFLKNREAMQKFCTAFKNCELKGHWIPGTYGIKIETRHYTFYTKCFPSTGDYNFYMCCYLLTDENELKRRAQEYELVVLEAVLSSMKMDDIFVFFDDDDILVAKDDDGNCWVGKEFYEFITEEALCFNPDGTLVDGLYMREDLLKKYRELSAANGVVPGKPTHDENGGADDGDN